MFSPIEHLTRESNQGNQAKNKGIQINKEELKLCTFADGMILSIECPQDFTKKNYQN